MRSGRAEEKHCLMKPGCRFEEKRYLVGPGWGVRLVELGENDLIARFIFIKNKQ